MNSLSSTDEMTSLRRRPRRLGWSALAWAIAAGYSCTFTLGLVGAAAAPAIAKPSPGKQVPPPLIYVDEFSSDYTDDQAEDDDLIPDRPEILRELRTGEDATDRAEAKADRQADLLARLPGEIQRAITRRLNQAIARAVRGDGLLANADADWVVRGQLVVVEEGTSRVLPAGIDYGAKLGRVELRVQVATIGDPDHPFLEFGAAGVTGRGLAEAPGTISYRAAVRLQMARQNPEVEARRLGRIIAEEIGRYLAAKNILTIQEMARAGLVVPPLPRDGDLDARVYSSKRGDTGF